MQAFSAPFALLADGLSFVASALFLGSIRPVEPPTETSSAGHVVAGLRFVRESPILCAKLAATATINFFNFVFFALFVLFATRDLGIRPGTLGLVLGAASVGGILGALVTGRVTRRIGVGPTFVLGCVLFPGPVPARALRGRAEAARAPAALPRGVRHGRRRDELAGGFLGSALGLRPTLAIAAAGGLGGVLFLVRSPLPRLRELPEPAA